MKTPTKVIAGLLLLTVAASASGPKNTKENPAQDRKVRYQELISKSKAEVNAISTGVDGLLKTVNEAKDSNDKAKMKSALDASAKHLVEMKEHAANCMKHMESLESSVSQEAR